MLAGTTVTLPSITTAAVGTVAVLTAAGLVGRYIARPLIRSARYVRELLETFGAVVEQVADLVTYVALFVVDVEARLDRIERALNLGPYKRRAEDEPINPAPTLKEALAERLHATRQIRDLGAD